MIQFWQVRLHLLLETPAGDIGQRGVFLKCGGGVGVFHLMCLAIWLQCIVTLIVSRNDPLIVGTMVQVIAEGVKSEFGRANSLPEPMPILNRSTLFATLLD